MPAGLKIGQRSIERRSQPQTLQSQGAGGVPQRTRPKPDQNDPAAHPILRGWANYFRLTEQKGVLEDRDGWLRHKLRALLWRQWKRTSVRARNLMKRGLTKERAWTSASNGRGPWWNGGASHMNQAFPKSWFAKVGLISLLDTRQRFQTTS